MKLRLIATAAVGAAAALALSGCGPSTGPATSTGVVPSHTTASVAKPAAGKPISLDVGTTSLGQAVTVQGRTVYRFDGDGNNPPKSTCEGQCLVAWPPLLTDGTATQVGAQIDSAKVGTLTRSDGSVQVTLNGWPLYVFGQDTAAGDVKGEGVGGKWHVIGTDGKPLKKA